jgi:hypothetical protein
VRELRRRDPPPPRLTSAATGPNPAASDRRAEPPPPGRPGLWALKPFTGRATYFDFSSFQLTRDIEMTDLISPAATAAFRRDVGEKTVLMRTEVATAPISPLPRYETVQRTLPPREGLVLPDATAELMPPLPGEPPRPQPPMPHPVPPPGWAAPAAVYPLVLPAPLERVAGPDETEVVSLLGALGGVEAPRARRSQPYRKPQGWVRTRRHRAPMPVPALLACCYGAGLAGGMTILSIAWQVTR